MPITSDDKIIYVCCYERRGKCGNSPGCIANGGPCASTTDPDFAVRDEHGNPVVQTEDSK